MHIAAAYIRVSTEEQTEYSLDAQIKALKDYSIKNNIFLAEEFIFREEGISGRTASKRPEFQKMISLAKKKPRPFDVILVHKFDRFARNREDSVVYKSLLRKECGIRVISITEPLEDDKMSILIEALLEAMAEYYSLNLSDEVMKGLLEKANRGERCGKSAYGYSTENGKLIINEKEAHIVRLIFDMHKKNSSTAIAKYLNQNHILTRNGGRWYSNNIIYMLSNPVYKGYIRYNYFQKNSKELKPEKDWIITKGIHEPIIDEHDFDLSLEKLNAERKTAFKNVKTDTPKHWLQHILICADCGHILGRSSAGQGRCPQFRCNYKTMKLCNSQGSITTKKIEQQIIKKINDDFQYNNCLNKNNAQDEDKEVIEVIEEIEEIEIIEKTEEIIEEIIIEENPEPYKNNEREYLEIALKKNQNKLQLIKTAFLNGIDTIDEYRENKLQLQKEETEITAKLKEIDNKNINVPKAQKKIKIFTDLLGDPSLSEAEKNKIAKQFIKAIKLDLKTKEFQIIYFIDTFN